MWVFLNISHDSRVGNDIDNEIKWTSSWNNKKVPIYHESPLIKQYNAEYLILGDLVTPPELRSGSFAKRVFSPEEADVIGTAKGVFRKKVGNEDYARQREVLDFVKGSEAWKHSGGRDHVFVLTGCISMYNASHISGNVEFHMLLYKVWKCGIHLCILYGFSENI
ncbi:putative exostosin [Helianthus annuus]|uniref:Exostosin n=1 Tax=Helianthus annuus TaxID=4232 RepID=A0A9K3JD35_HELAN|nr:putative exostosin [Helianthus annuus]KAJ0592026.1 putative exostosin [Helianthus annuus]KAJ0599423.1 putative exostosin [Helianthus annuus]KAJ0607004.1 putative exostosin [Helianthus annuus]KAJ0767064.1 putative exostosin [Helianthus annuus]